MMQKHISKKRDEGKKKNQLSLHGSRPVSGASNKSVQYFFNKKRACSEKAWKDFAALQRAKDFSL